MNYNQYQSSTPPLSRYFKGNRPYLHHILKDLGCPTSNTYRVLRSFELVVERSSIRGFDASYPIHYLFKRSRLGLFHPYVVVLMALRAF